MAVAQPHPEDYRTSDMAMTTYLRMGGHQHQAISWENNTCYWYFIVSDALMEAVDLFVRGEAKVEPREYNRMFTKTKQEFYSTRQSITNGGKAENP